MTRTLAVYPSRLYYMSLLSANVQFENQMLSSLHVRDLRLATTCACRLTVPGLISFCTTQKTRYVRAGDGTSGNRSFSSLSLFCLLLFLLFCRPFSFLSLSHSSFPLVSFFPLPLALSPSFPRFSFFLSFCLPLSPTFSIFLSLPPSTSLCLSSIRVPLSFSLFPFLLFLAAPLSASPSLNL